MKKPKNVLRLAAYFDPTRDAAVAVAAARKHLKGVDFDTFVATGLSGATVAPILARAFHKNVLIIRKHDDRCHDSNPAVGALGERWVFVDDFISTGSTFERVLLAVCKLEKDFSFRRPTGGQRAEFVGAFCYGGSYESPSYSPAERLTRYLERVAP
jgi:adenine/guanine phosphoribosyltransferase-like PRPP-binding protein